MTKVKAVKFVKRLLLVSVVLILVAEALLYLRPLPTLQPVINIKNPTASNPTALPWPPYGQSAIGAEGFGVLASSGEQKPAPIASVAKVMTAYSVLKQKPLKPGQQGPIISISDQDVLTYNDYYSKGGSVAKVVPGEKISEYQALQALMLPSANNFADTLAIWHNVNWLLGTDNVNGIKTGNTEEAMGCFLFSSVRNVNGQKITLIGAIMGAPNLNKAISDARPLIGVSDQSFEKITAVKSGQVIGYYQLPWGGRVQATAKKDLLFFMWKGQTIGLSAKLKAVSVPQPAGTVVGTVNVKADKKSDTAAVGLNQEIPKPSWKWRIFDR
jgi:D-alanyl-D-alanine carboxypeptidase